MMGKEIVPIFVDAAYSANIFYQYVMGFFYNFYIKLFICSEDIGSLTEFIKCIYYYYINSIPIGYDIYQCSTTWWGNV